MRKLNHEQQEAINVQYVRRLLGFDDAHVDAQLDALIRQELKRYRYYDDVVDSVKRRMAISK